MRLASQPIKRSKMRKRSACRKSTLWSKDPDPGAKLRFEPYKVPKSECDRSVTPHRSRTTAVGRRRNGGYSAAIDAWSESSNTCLLRIAQRESENGRIEWPDIPDPYVNYVAERARNSFSKVNVVLLRNAPLSVEAIHPGSMGGKLNSDDVEYRITASNCEKSRRHAEFTA
jgi:hypothetical protein